MIRHFTSKNQVLGEEGEKRAAEFLVKQGYSVIDRNVANRYGEIDIIAKKAGMYHFFEVKTGREGGWFNPAENMTAAKRRKFCISVEHYCLVHHIINFHLHVLIVTVPTRLSDKARVEPFFLN